MHIVRLDCNVHSGIALAIAVDTRTIIARMQMTHLGYLFPKVAQMVAWCEGYRQLYPTLQSLARAWVDY